MREFTRLGKSDGWTALHVELYWMAGMKNSSGAAGLPRRKMERIVGKHKFNRLAESADATKYDSTPNEIPTKGGNRRWYGEYGSGGLFTGWMRGGGDDTTGVAGRLNNRR